MWPCPEWLLTGWTALAALWWWIALRLVRASPKLRRRPGDAPVAGHRCGEAAAAATLTIFKPLPRLPRDAPTPDQVAALESFVAQLDSTAEMLLGIEQPDRDKWRPLIENWRCRYPSARLQVICVPRPAQFLSPKVSWHHTLAEHARGQWWMWSDADMIAPAGFLDAVRDEFARSGVNILTCPYLVRRVRAAPMMLEALFANVEFLPGALLCKRLGHVRFAFGACILFRADAFGAGADWERLGARLADDCALGQALGPVRISDIALETLAAESAWRDAAQHYLRWHKTVRWNRPAGYAGQIIIVPLLGWLACVLTRPAMLAGWAGLGATILMEMAVALALFRSVGCPLPPRWLWTLPVWSLLRAATWAACWLPWPVVFRSQNRRWWSLYHSEDIPPEKAAR
jgi:hypothetical protein